MVHFTNRIPPQPIVPVPQQQNAGIKRTAGGQSPFADALRDAAARPESLSISKHAGQRLAQRNIRIDQSVWNKVEEKVAEASRKGIKDSLVLLDNAALIINAKNRTVITAMNRKEASDQIFTNIDGTIVMD